MKRLILLAVLSLIIVPHFASASFDANLKYGMRSDSVNDLQELLVDQNCLSTSPTGYFGILTLKAVKCFQAKYDISPVSGYVGILTRTKMNEILANVTSDSDKAEVSETGTTTPVTQSCPQGFVCTPANQPQPEQSQPNIGGAVPQQPVEVSISLGEQSCKVTEVPIDNGASNPTKKIVQYNNTTPIITTGQYATIEANVTGPFGENGETQSWNPVSNRINAITSQHDGTYSYTITVYSGSYRNDPITHQYIIDRSTALKSISGSFTTNCGNTHIENITN